MSSLFQAAKELQSVCDQRGWECCFIGGIALQRWGEPRYTHDADLSLITGFSGEENYIDALLECFPGRIAGAREFALSNRVLLLEHGPTGIPLDIALAGLPFEAASVARSSVWAAEDGCLLRTCSAEDLIVHKAFASRGKDWVDIEGVLVRQGDKLKRDQILRDLAPLVALKEEPEIMARLRRLLAKPA